MVSERAAAGTRASDYVSAVQCRSRAGRGPIVAQAPGSRVAYTAAAGQVVACVLINIRRSPPAPSPVPQPDPSPTPPGGGVGELDLQVTARPVSTRIPAGADARWLVRVRNRSHVAATDVRLAAAVRQAEMRLRTAALVVTGGACARSRGAGTCHVRRIESGGSVLVRARVRSRDLLAPVRLVVAARAAEPEPVLANNLDRTRVRIIRPPELPCPASAGAAGPMARVSC